jgi:pyruvate/2-oxoacid:ferredoxin oxidoreductase beta subunit
MNASTLEIPCEIPADARNPVEPFLRMDRMPHIWCPACGIGTTVNCFTRALEESKANLDKVAIVSGIGCTGRVAGYANLDSFHTTHGRAIPFATGLKRWSTRAMATFSRSAATTSSTPPAATWTSK